MTSSDEPVSDEIIVDTVDQEAAEVPKRRRGGSAKGRRFQRVKRSPGEALERVHMTLRPWEKALLAELGGGDVTAGTRKLVEQAAKLLGKGPHANKI